MNWNAWENYIRKVHRPLNKDFDMVCVQAQTKIPTDQIS